MILSSSIKKSNISEYILYMLQIENIIKSLSLDIKKIQEAIIDKHSINDTQKAKLKNWYIEIIKEMNSESYKKNQCLKRTLNYINKLNDIHLTLLNNDSQNNYKELYLKSKEDIDLFKEKINQVFIENEIYVLLKGLYYKLLLNLKRQPIHKGSEIAFNNFTSLIKILTIKYNEKYRTV